MNSKTILKVKPVKLNRAERELKGQLVPKEKYGNVGIHVELAMVDMDYELDRRSNGPDIPALRCETKTRKIGATSANTVGTMTLNDIVSTPYKESPIYKKFQFQFRVMHNQTFLEIASSKVYDFTIPEIQKSVEHSYESTRQEIKEWYKHPGRLPKYIRGKNAECYWELKDGESYAFRIPDGVMKKFETLSNVDKQYKTLFE